MKIIRAAYLEKLRQLRATNLIKVVTGMRRVGKSTLLADFREELRASGVAPARLHAYNFEDPAYRGKLDWGVLYDEIFAKLVPAEKNYIFLDEIQNIPQFERMADGLFIQPNVDLYITGSNAFLLSGELATLLSGRYITTNVMPYSFAEYASGFPNANPYALLRQYLDNSAMPEAVNLGEQTPEQVRQYLREVFEAVIQKDIKTRVGIYGLNNFDSVAKFVFDNVGSFVSPGKIADTLNEGRPKEEQRISHNTVAAYLAHLAGAFALYRADRYDICGRRLLKTQQKYYAVDLGLKDAITGGGDRKTSLGRRLENAVYFELRRRNYGDIWVGKQDDKEVDFVVQNRAGERSYYQVALTVSDENTLERELASLRKIKDNHPKFLLTSDYSDNSIGGIQLLNVVDWLLDT
jgi:predicted AAA+ superfamily ATPase